MALHWFQNRRIFDTLDGLRDGLSHFSGPSRAAVLFAVRPEDPLCIFDPQNLLHGHELKFKELYLDSDEWRRLPAGFDQMPLTGQTYPVKNLDLTGLISYGGRSPAVFYQMWFTEHHLNMCAIGPTERWLEHAAWRLSTDLMPENFYYTGISGYFLREYAAHAVRDHIVDQLNILLGWDTQLRVYPILDAVLGISKTREEGAWPRGQIVFVEQAAIEKLAFIARFPKLERPSLQNFKHVRKTLLAVEGSLRKLVSDGSSIFGIAAGALPQCRITADYRGGHGFLRFGGEPVCSFLDGNFLSTTYKANLVHVEEMLLESPLDPDEGNRLFKIVASIVHHAQEQKFGCTLVLDLNPAPVTISGQDLEAPLDLREDSLLDLTRSLARMDGALHISADLRLQRFACLLDGKALREENRARGARYNSALRFSAEHPRLMVVVVSADHPVSLICEGVELNAQCEWKPVSGCGLELPTLTDWVARGLAT
ncbi:MAG: DNA integrity scanning protein DisA nucleotide-binding domain protein [Desulfobacterales bacterium]|nr:DNA integrity scanning protein DisA nucleotide-binding domain protein [Desulfobacterales bacterium]